MIWLTLRQHRTELVVLIGLSIVIGVVLLITGQNMHHLYDQLGIAACLSANSEAGQCTRAIAQFSYSPYSNLQSYFPWLNLIPALYGVLIGAPLLAREYEQGTCKFIWTQGKTRRCWLLIESGVLLTIFLILAVLTTLIMTWWNGPLVALNGPFPLASYDFAGFNPVAYATFALALGTAAGALARRVIPAIAATFLYIPIWLLLDNAVRGFLIPPIVRYYSLETMAGYPNLTQQDWIVTQGVADRLGHTVSDSIPDAVCGHALSGQYEQCLFNHGFQGIVAYHPPAISGRCRSSRRPSCSLRQRFCLVSLFGEHKAARRRRKDRLLLPALEAGGEIAPHAQHALCLRSDQLAGPMLT